MDLEKSFPAIVKKNLIILSRTKTSSLLLLIGPLLLVFFVGLAFDNYKPYAVSLGFVGNDTPSTQLVVQSLAPNFRLSEFRRTQDCVNGVKQGSVHACIVFPSNFTVGKRGSNEVVFYVDYSKINLVWSIVGSLNQPILDQSSELSMNLTGVILDALEITRDQVMKERQALIGLATLTNNVSKGLVGVKGELSETKLSVDVSKFRVKDFSDQKQMVRQWIDNSLDIAQDSLTQADKFIQLAYRDSKAGGDRTAQEAMKKVLGDVEVLKQRYADTKVLADADYSKLGVLFDNVISEIQATKKLLDDSNLAQQQIVQNVDSAVKLLDVALVQILSIQQSVNIIEEAISKIEVRDPALINQPISTTVRPITVGKSYLHFLFPDLVAILIMFTALILTQVIVFLETRGVAAFRTALALRHPFELLAGIFATVMLIVGAQFLIVLVFTSLFSLSVLTNVVSTIIVVFFVGSLFTLIGLCVGYCSPSEETATVVSISLGSLMLFLSNSILPLESMYWLLLKLAHFNPLVLSSGLIRKTMVFSLPIWKIIPDLVVLLLYLAILVCLIVFLTSDVETRASILSRAKSLSGRFKK